MKRKHELNDTAVSLLIAGAAALLFIPFLGGVHLFDWDEINFAESAREMITSGDYLNVQINFEVFWEKPPLFIWMQVLCMKLFGVGEFAARLPNAVCGMLTLPALYRIGKRVANRKTGLLWVLFHAGSLLPFLYFKSGIIDPWFNLFIFLSLYMLHLYFATGGRQVWHAAASGTLGGLAVLTKGPVALLVIALTTFLYILSRNFRVRIRVRDVAVFILMLSFTGGLWFILQILNGNLSVIMDFIDYQIRLFTTEDAGHGGFLLYHVVVLLIGVFPASFFALPLLAGIRRPETGSFLANHARQQDFCRWMLILFWVVLVIFTIVRTKIVHYSSLCYFPLTFMAAWSLIQGRSSHGRWKRITAVSVTATGILLAMAVAAVSRIDSYKDVILEKGWIGDPFARACLMAEGGWKGYEPLAVLPMLAGIIAFAGKWRRGHNLAAVAWLTISMPLFMFLSTVFIVPRVESYSQGAAIEFFDSVSHEGAYLSTLGYKSYAHLFYGRQKEHAGMPSGNKNWLLEGDTDKVAYFASKINRKDELLDRYTELELLYEKNGFAFYRRLPDLKP